MKEQKNSTFELGN